MAEAAADTNMIAFEKFEEIAEKICDLANNNLEIGDDLVAQFLAELEKTEGKDVEEIEDFKETVKEELELLLEELTQQRATDTTPESRDSRLSSYLASASFRLAFGYLKGAIIGKSGVKTTQRTGVDIKYSTTTPDGTIKTLEVFAGKTQTFAPKIPAINSQSVKEDEK